MISTLRIRTRRRVSSSCVVVLSTCIGLGALGCGGNQSDPQYPEDGHGEEAPPPDPLGIEGVPDDDVHGDPNTMPGDQTETMPGEQPGAAPNESGAGGPQGAAPRDAQPVARVTAEEVDAFSACLVRIMELQKRFQQRAEQGEPQDQLQTEFQQQAVGILKQEGLSPQRYDEIAQLMSADLQLQQRVREAIEAEAKS